MDPTLLVHAARSVVVGNRGWPPTRIEAHWKNWRSHCGRCQRVVLVDRCHLEPTGSPLGHAKITRRVGRSRGVAKRALRLRRYGSTSLLPPTITSRSRTAYALLEAIMNAKHANLTPNGRRELKKRAPEGQQEIHRGTASGPHQSLCVRLRH